MSDEARPWLPWCGFDRAGPDELIEGRCRLVETQPATLHLSGATVDRFRCPPWRSPVTGHAAWSC